jgi:hypothetical protein
MLLDELSAYLAANGIGTLGTDIFIGQLPESPDAACALYEYGGIAPAHTIGGGTAKYERPRVQVVARALTYSAARSKIESIYTLLDAVAGAMLSSVRYLRIEAVQSPAFLERDANNRVTMVCNFQVQKELSP